MTLIVAKIAVPTAQLIWFNLKRKNDPPININHSKIYRAGELRRCWDFGAAQIAHRAMAISAKPMAKNHLFVKVLPRENP